MTNASEPTFQNSMGTYYTKALFVEHSTPESDWSLVRYTLRDQDVEKNGVTYPSVRRLFVELEDESEYLFATTYFASWKHYQKLLRCKWFICVIEDARQELQVRLASRNLQEIRKKAEQGNLQANTYLLEQKHREKKSSVGRPTKARILEEANSLIDERDEVSDDLGRILEFKQR